MSVYRSGGGFSVTTASNRANGHSNRVPKFMKLDPKAVIPRRHYADDIGWDLAARVDQLNGLEIPPGQFVDVPCGLSVQLPRGTWGLLIGRSSALRKHGLIMTQGVIDEGYTGPLFAGAFNTGRDSVWVQDGVRLAQLIVIPRYDPISIECLEITEMCPTSRGSAGFGSTD